MVVTPPASTARNWALDKLALARSAPSHEAAWLRREAALICQRSGVVLPSEREVDARLAECRPSDPGQTRRIKGETERSPGAHGSPVANSRAGGAVGTSDDRYTTVGCLTLLILIVVILGYAIFQDFRWILWLLALAGVWVASRYLVRFWKWLCAGGFPKLTKGLSLVPGIQHARAVLSGRRARRECVICRSGVASVLLVESLANEFATPVTMCRKHAQQAHRIWVLEYDLGFQLTGCVGYRVPSTNKK